MAVGFYESIKEKSDYLGEWVRHELHDFLWRRLMGRKLHKQYLKGKPQMTVVEKKQVFHQKRGGE